MKTITTLFFLLFSSIVLCASGIQGVITNDQDETLPFANVYILGTTNGTTSNAEGLYQLELEKGNYDIVFQYVGYKEKNHSGQHY